jgi:hypothetical protein
MDPLGFSLENFDWFGRWRVRAHRRPIDALGSVPDGTEFTGPTGLKHIILERRLDDLARQIIRKILAYALGRQLEYYDETAVEKVYHSWREDDFRMQTLVHEIVMSYPFQFKKNRTAVGEEQL